jgi:Collagen triple helix repeat (20 copies)
MRFVTGLALVLLTGCSQMRAGEGIMSQGSAAGGTSNVVVQAATPAASSGLPTIYVAPGRDGSTGRDGRDGLVGRDGHDGRDAVRGERGTDGRSGDAGRDGRDGLSGRDGRDGHDGRDGVQGRDGRDGRDGTDGRVVGFPVSVTGTPAILLFGHSGKIEGRSKDESIRDGFSVLSTGLAAIITALSPLLLFWLEGQKRKEPGSLAIRELVVLAGQALIVFVAAYLVGHLIFVLTASLLMILCAVAVSAALLIAATGYFLKVTGLHRRWVRNRRIEITMRAPQVPGSDA